MNKAWSAVVVAVLKYVLGPVVAVILGVGYSSQNHEKSIKSYEVLARALNDQVLSRLNHLDQRLDVLEARVDKLESRPASQPFNIQRIIIPGGRVDPLDIGKAMKAAPRPATLSSKVLTKAAQTKPAPRQQLVPPTF